jgi:putative spermidine/putrescine transport system permease protein
MIGFLRRSGYIYMAVVMVFVLTPALVVVFDSINSATSFPSPFEHATLHWYAVLLDQPDFLSAAWVSVKVAAVSALAATIVSFLAAYGLSRYKIRARNAVITGLMGPLLVPEIVMGLAILGLTNIIDVAPTLPVLSATHTVFIMPFVLRLVLASFTRFDFNLEDAARSLGAGPLRALWYVTLPLTRPALLAGFTLSAIMSFVNLPISMFLTTPQTATLPVAVFSYIESRIDPVVAAVATLVVVISALATLFLDRVLRIRIIG